MGSYHVEPVLVLGMKSLRIELIIASYRVHCKFGGEIPDGQGENVSQKRSSRDQPAQQMRIIQFYCSSRRSWIAFRRSPLGGRVR